MYLSEYEVAFAFVEFTEGGKGKRRPVLITDIDGDKISFYKITSQYFNKSEYIRKRYYPIRDWLMAGLDRQSWVDTISELTYDGQKVRFTVCGRFSNYDIDGLKQFISQLEVEKDRSL